MNPLQIRLASLRRRMIMVNLWRGGCTLFAAVVGLVLTAGLADWNPTFLLRFTYLHKLTSVLDWHGHLPAGVRGLLLVGALVVLIGGFVRFLYLPLTHRLDDLSLALRIEEIYPELNDNLASAVQFLDEPEENLPGSKVMRQHAIEHALKRADHCDFSNVIDRRGVLLRPAGALAVALIAAYFVLYHWAFSVTAMTRLFDPFGGHTWTQIDVDEIDKCIAQGQPFAIKGKVTGVIPTQARLDIKGTILQTDNKVVPIKQSRAFEGTFHAALDMSRAKSGKFRFRISANDGKYPASGGWSNEIEVLPPPRLAPLDGYPSPQIELRFPAYTNLRSPRLLSPGQGLVDAVDGFPTVAGTRVLWKAAVDRPVVEAWLEVEPEVAGLKDFLRFGPLGQSQPLDHLGLMLLGQSAAGRMPVKIDPTGTLLSVEFTAWMSATYTVHFRDDNGKKGLANDYKNELRIFNDPPPIVQLKKPAMNDRAFSNVVLDAEIGMQMVVEDRIFAIRSVFLEYRRKNDSGEWLDDRWHTAPILNVELASALASLPRQPFAVPLLRPDTLELGHTWALRRYFKEGDIVIFRACADDFNDLFTPRAVGRSHDVELRIVSKKELNQDLNAEFEKVREEILALQRKQEEALQNVKEVQANKDKMDLQAQRDKLIAAEQLQAEIKKDIGSKDDGLRQKLAAMKERMRDNKLPPSDLQDRVKTVASELERVARVDLPQIENNLAEVRRQAVGDKKQAKLDVKPDTKPDVKPPVKPDTKPEAKKDPLDQAQAFQNDAKKTLDELANFLNPWASQQQIKDKLQKLIVDQKDLRKDTSDLAKKDDGPTKTDLDPRADRQQLLAKGADDVLSMIKAVKASKKNPDAEPKLAAAEKIAEQTKPAEAMRDISGQLRNVKPKLQKAVQDQNKVIGDLEKMLAALEKPDREKEMDVLSKKRKDAKKDLDKLNKKIEGLNKKIAAARKLEDPLERADALKKLGPEQEELKEEAQKLARELARLNADKASRDLDRAAQEMDKAAGKMAAGDDPGGEAQKQIEKDVKQAKRDLEQVEQELAREKNAMIADELKGFKERQDGLLKDSARLHEQMVSKNKWTDGMRKSLKESGESQKDLSNNIDPVKKKLEEVAPVSAYVLERAVSAMGQAAEAIEQRTKKERLSGEPLAKEALDMETRDHENVLKRQKEASQRLGRIIEALKEDKKDKVAEKPPEKPPEKPKEGDPKQKGDEPKQAGPKSSGDGIPQDAELKLLGELQDEVLKSTDEINERYPDREKRTPEQKREASALYEAQVKISTLWIQMEAMMKKLNDKGDE